MLQDEIVTRNLGILACIMIVFTNSISAVFLIFTQRKKPKWYSTSLTKKEKKRL